MLNNIKYTGKALETAQKELDLEVYKPSQDLVSAVNLALFLERPLLLMGEPGCGKTRLAEALAYELHGESFKKHFFQWNIKSTSKAQDGIYSVNYLQRLYDANFKDTVKKDLSIKKYIDYGVMHEALMKAENEGKPNVLLIDEIDKADIDFPNDLLLELDKKEFFIPELGKNNRVKAKSKVVTIITSNQEKELPPAFLRRCLYHYIEFPNEKDLAEIVSKRFDIEIDDTLMKKAIEAFINLRDEKIEGTDKKPSTSELINWFEVLQFSKTLETKENRSEEEEYFVKQIELLGTDKIPFKQILLKNYNSFIRTDE